MTKLKAGSLLSYEGILFLIVCCSFNDDVIAEYVTEHDMGEWLLIVECDGYIRI
jgi:hypothetical protein